MAHDDIDLRILRLLAADARLSARAIARAIDMSPGAVTDRVAKLEASGAIGGYHAAVDRSRLGYDLAALIGVQIEQGLPLDDTIARLLEMEEVVGVRVVTGRWDVMVELIARDHEHLRSLLFEGVWSIPGFRHSETMVVLDDRSRPAGWIPEDGG